MLVLARKEQESIIISGNGIANNIEIVVLGIHKDKVKLGINAPDEISINRKEVYLAMHR